MKGMPQRCSTQEAKNLLYIPPHLSVIGWGLLPGYEHVALLASPVRGLNKPPRPGEYAGRGQQALAVRSHLREWEQPSLELIGMGPLLISVAGHSHFC